MQLQKSGFLQRAEKFLDTHILKELVLKKLTAEVKCDGTSSRKFYCRQQKSKYLPSIKLEFIFLISSP